VQHKVKDGVRTYEFSGVLLAHSSSKFGNKPRWVEFDLYKMANGEYMVSRVGFSVYYHDESCFTVGRNHLSRADGLELPAEYAPCEKCKPFRGNPEGVFPETPRPAAWRCPDAEGVVDSLKKEDENNGVLYLTNVVKRLLTEASGLDKDISDAFYYERIPDHLHGIAN
jgi:hypothetical protein